MKPTIYNFSQSWNLGDRVCSPHLYFDWLKDCPVKDPSEWTPGPSIFGGGGILHPGFDHILAAAIRSGEKTATWGIGLNYHGVKAQLYPKFLDESSILVGMRERLNPWNFVPCPSCMADEFNIAKMRYPDFDEVIYQHRDWKIEGEVPRLNNSCQSLWVALNHIASGKTVITNSFHGAYWAKLLGRNVKIHDPFSNRFLAIDDGEWDLETCRALNFAWSEKLKKYFSS